MSRAHFVFLWSLLHPVSASADPCATGDGMATGPVTAGRFARDLGHPRRVCGRSELGINLGAVVPTRAAGPLTGDLALEGSMLLGERTEMFASLEAFRYQSTGGELPTPVAGLGHLALGLNHQFWSSETVALSFQGKAVLPTAIAEFRGAWPFGVDLGLASVWSPVPGITLQGHLVGLLSGIATPTPNVLRGGIAPSLGLGYRPSRAFGAVVNLMGTFGYEDTVDYLGWAIALRVTDGKRFGAELGGLLPFYGAYRGAATADLRLTWRLGPMQSPF